MFCLRKTNSEGRDGGRRGVCFPYDKQTLGGGVCFADGKQTLSTGVCFSCEKQTLGGRVCFANGKQTLRGGTGGVGGFVSLTKNKLRGEG